MIDQFGERQRSVFDHRRDRFRRHGVFFTVDAVLDDILQKRRVVVETSAKRSFLFTFSFGKSRRTVSDRSEIISDESERMPTMR